ncbi:MAG: hypothetical protein V3W18_14035 [candidate division Zixibacteria bacterium]
MKAFVKLGVFVAVLLALSCNGVKVSQETIDKANAEKKAAAVKLDKNLRQMAMATKQIAAPLKALTPEEMVSVASLIMVSNNLTAARAGGIEFEKEIREIFVAELVAISPELGKAVAPGIFGGACWDQSLAYASAMASCEKDGTSEEDCWEANGALGTLMGCEQREMARLKEEIKDLWGGLKPPKPDPWPDPTIDPDPSRPVDPQ